MRRPTIERRNVRLAEIVLIVIAILGVAYLGDSVIGSRLLSATRTVTVDLPSGGGLYPGANVTYRGNSIGEVRDVRLEDDGVRATVRLDGDTRIPTDTEAVAANLSAIGEQYLDFRPRVDHGPYLQDGDTVGRADTRVPIRFDKLLTDVNDVADLIDPDDLQTITTELGDAFDSGTDLVLLGQRMDHAVSLLARLQPRLRHLMEQSQAPLRTVVDTGHDIRSFAHDLDLVTASVKKSDPTLRSLIDEVNVLASSLGDLIADITPDIGRTARAWTAFGQLGTDRLPGFDHWLTWAPPQAVAMSESTRDGTGHVLMVPNPSDLCDYGLPKRSPYDTTRHPARTDAHCTVESPLIQQRGSQYAPRPAN
ncbi:hypothetical protein C6I20_01440 [Aeromicrobium sp. A1-2]|uniref:MCE family protein n=1 Tax=Aeromicrobium sp. A1-2 TaxID=2107713 RepID=UPI000E47B5CB|nr:MlaD family protein [Aeromicrobium sp. A1-2]AXT83983.1 hypothetical protein C6I20_01440 [Aeromicrobium sp. A1-2]